MKDKNSEERFVERSSRKRSSESIPHPWRRSFGDSIWDWGTAAKLCVGAWRRAWGRITALAYLNAHEHALLAVASHSGQLALFRPARGALEPALLAAWRALPAQPAGDYRPPPAHPVYSQSIPPPSRALAFHRLCLVLSLIILTARLLKRNTLFEIHENKLYGLGGYCRVCSSRWSFTKRSLWILVSTWIYTSRVRIAPSLDLLAS